MTNSNQETKSFSKFINEQFDSSITINIDNIDEEQKHILKNILYLMEYLGNLGTSANITIYADGDGAFRPKIKVNEEGLNNIESQLDLIGDIDNDEFYFEFD